MKSWTVIPAMGVVSSAAAIAILRDPVAAAASGLAGAAVAAAVRALAPSDPAAIVAAVLAPLLLIASLAENAAFGVAPCIAVAAIAWTLALLARPVTHSHGHAESHDGSQRHRDAEKSFLGRSGTRPSDISAVAMLPAIIAAVLEPAAVALVPIAAARLITSRGHARTTWVVAVPIAGVLAVMLAAIAGTAHDGMFASLGTRWFGAPHPIAAHDVPALVGTALGPLTAVAAMAGIALLAKLRLAEIAVVSTLAGSLLCDLRAGAVGPTTLAIAALCAALAIGRFARTIRLPNLQAVAGATVAAMLLVPPAWTVIELMR